MVFLAPFLPPLVSYDILAHELVVNILVSYKFWPMYSFSMGCEMMICHYFKVKSGTVFREMYFKVRPLHTLCCLSWRSGWHCWPVCWWAGAGAQVAGPGEKDGLNNRTQTETDEIQ